MTCAAYRQGDEWHCPGCALRWAVSDPEPPRCRAEELSSEPEARADRGRSARWRCPNRSARGMIAFAELLEHAHRREHPYERG